MCSRKQSDGLQRVRYQKALKPGIVNFNNNDVVDYKSISSFDHLVKGKTSVGLNALAFVNDIKDALL